MPPGSFSLLEKLSECEDKVCVENVVDEYLYSLVKGKRQIQFKLTEDDEDLDEKTIANSYIFTEFLITRLLNSDIDINLVVKDLEEKLGKDHPVIVFLKQLKEE
ncbi:hypothetical protein DFR85_08860 [Acidianus brierleyi]|uniref:Uncharacterized protein n=1 Tax=Acidianus brierleyi TaxID=41673 RepID=A0A2U9IIU0_9CREN|nr:hypothetical protein DFR85_08860 [Acidianus brierleyi]